ncbi:hypothetical protein [Streptomyces cinnamoneus]|uniref:Uncharacterized protein n=1 Tax=Streptomyces cinnamoneus TaxID=53446 RepID=A0A918TJ99_STRCJ|nr:hypothetical protein [Streptomyces cinnamoneus]GHC48264.1 hypothetical protein GCM10010507_24750 [Streptomyces cinnamoneus]
MHNADVRDAVRSYAADIALALSVHRGVDPALVWPDTEPSGLLDGLATHAAARLATAPAEPSPAALVAAGPEAGPLSGFLGEALGCAVTARYGYAPPGVPGREILADGDLLVIPVDRGCDCSVHPPARPAPLRMRLLKGEVLYVPQDFAMRVSGRHASSPLLVITFPSPGAPGVRSSGSRIRTPAP